MDGPLGDAIRQAREQGRSRGAGFCGVTNGDTWIIFPVNRRDGVSFEESSAIIFRTAEEVLNSAHSEFIDTFSRPSVIAGSLDIKLLGGMENQKEVRRINQVYPNHFSAPYRTSLYRHIEPAIATAFSEDLLSSNADVLESAYVDTPDRIRFDSRIGMVIKKRDQVFKTKPIKPLSKSGRKSSTDVFNRIGIESKPTAIITLGLVGAGKTTFLHHINLVSCKSLFDRTREEFALWLYADFRDFSKFQSPRTYLYDTLYNYINQDEEIGDYEKTVKPAYQVEIEALMRGPLSIMKDNEDVIKRAIYEHINKDLKDKEPYVNKLLKHTSIKHPIYLVIDNVDQIESTDIQEDIFSEAVTLARNINAHLVLAMRDYTYVKNRASAIFDAFDYDAFYIDSPPVDSVLSKRFAIAERMVSGEVISETTQRGRYLNISDASEVVRVLRKSVLGTNVGRVIQIAATGDIRLALRMTRQFLQFGYSSSIEKYFSNPSNNRRSRGLRLAEHEAIRAIMLGNQSVYSDAHSEFLNVFDSKIGRTELQFLRLFILSALVNLAADQNFEGCEAQDLYTDLEKIGISKRFSEQALSDLISRRLIFTRSHQPLSDESLVSPSRFGGYICRELLPLFVYLENMLYDTFISDFEVWKKIRTKFDAIYVEKDTVSRLRLRKEAVSAFYNFSSTEFQKLIVLSQRHSLSGHWLVNPFERARGDFDESLSRVMRSGQRQGNIRPHYTSK